MRHYTHLSIEEREKLYLRRGQGAKLREIARELGRSVSTISRELKRNERPRHPYSPSQAQKNKKKLNDRDQIQAVSSIKPSQLFLKYQQIHHRRFPSSLSFGAACASYLRSSRFNFA